MSQIELFNRVEHTNDFKRSLERSHKASDLPLWEICYRQFFPTMIHMADHRQDGDHQRAGIDRTIVLANSKTVTVDEKVRGKNRITGKVYSDIAVEEWSDDLRKSPGWVKKPLLCDYIAYAIVPLGKCYLLPVLQLQQAWEMEGEIWKSQYFCIRSKNTSWVTVSWAIPVAVLFKAIGNCLRATFDPINDFMEGE